MKDKLYIEATVKALEGGQFEVIASNSSEDRMGDTINVEGWDLRNFRKNPVMLWAHNSFAPPVAKVLKIGVKDKNLMAKGEFAPTPFAQELRVSVEEGFLSAVSVGFIPLVVDEKGAIDIDGKMYRRATEMEIKAFEEKRLRGGGLAFEKQELLEISWVSVPALASALVTSRKGAELPLLTKALKDMENIPDTSIDETDTKEESCADKDDTTKKLESLINNFMTQIGEAMRTLSAVQAQQSSTPVKNKGRTNDKMKERVTPELRLMRIVDKAMDEVLRKLKEDRSVNSTEIKYFRIAARLIEMAIIKAKAK